MDSIVKRIPGSIVPQTYGLYTPLCISLCTQLGTYSLHPIGYTFCEPNQVHILCTQLGTISLNPIRCMNYVSRFLPQKAQFRVEIAYQIGYIMVCTQLGTINHIPMIFLRPVRILRPGPGARQFISILQGVFGHRYGLKPQTESVVKINQEVWAYTSWF